MGPLHPQPDLISLSDQPWEGAAHPAPVGQLPEPAGALAPIVATRGLSFLFYEPITK